MEVFKTHIEGVCVLFPRMFRDERGFFMETFNQRNYSEIGIHDEFVRFPPKFGPLVKVESASLNR